MLVDLSCMYLFSGSRGYLYALHQYVYGLISALVSSHITCRNSAESIEHILHNPTYGAKSRPPKTPPAPCSALGPQYEQQDPNTDRAHDYERVDINENGAYFAASIAVDNCQYSHFNH